MTHDARDNPHDHDCRHRERHGHGHHHGGGGHVIMIVSAGENVRASPAGAHR